MTRVAVNGEVMRWARERSGTSLHDLTKRFPKLSEWETEETQPTLRQLEDFAKKTLTPLGYLFLADPPDIRLPIPDFRTVQQDAAPRPSPNLLETVYAMLRRQDWMREYLIELGQPPLRFVGEASPDDPAPQVAARMRDELGVGDAWAGQHATWTGALAALIGLVEDAGILVVSSGVVGNNTHRTLDAEEFRGFVLTDEYAPLVFINTVDGKAAQMFTLAHELAHVWFAKSAAFDLRDMQPAGVPVEQACNRVAAEFLVPEAEMLDAWRMVRGEPRPFDELARRFKVSALALLRPNPPSSPFSEKDAEALIRFWRTVAADKSDIAIVGKEAVRALSIPISQAVVERSFSVLSNREIDNRLHALDRYVVNMMMLAGNRPS